MGRGAMGSRGCFFHICFSGQMCKGKNRGYTEVGDMKPFRVAGKGTGSRCPCTAVGPGSRPSMDPPWSSRYG